jgi:predicted transcriptional regulator of viral defense system
VSKYPQWFRKTKEVKIDEEEIMRFIKKAKLFSTREIMDEFGINQRQALKVLWKFNALGKIENVGHGVWRIKD